MLSEADPGQMPDDEVPDQSGTDDEVPAEKSDDEVVAPAPGSLEPETPGLQQES
jgi:hypothetical protein